MEAVEHPVFVLPPASSSPSHPLHDLFLYFEENRRLRPSDQPQHPPPPQPDANALPSRPINSGRIPDPGESFRVPQDEIARVVADFQQRRAAFARASPVHHEEKELVAAIEHPVNPTLVSELDYVGVGVLVKVLAASMERDYIYPARVLDWLELALIATEEPVGPVVGSLLRTLLVLLCRARHAILDATDPSLAPLNRLITVLGWAFSQRHPDDRL